MNLRPIRCRLVASVMLLACVRLAADEQAPALSANPFDRPAWIADARAAPPGIPAAQQHGRIDLRATLMAGNGSLVDVGGKFFAIGDEVDGYLLLSIEEGTAVFRHADEIIRVSVKGDDKDQDDETE